MGFAGAYLQRAALNPGLIDLDSHPGLQLIVTIPVHRESGLEKCLDSLFLSAQHLYRASTAGGKGEPGAGGDSMPRVEVLILINASEAAPFKIMEENLATRADALAWIEDHPHPLLSFHLMVDHALPEKFAGVGLARKILMDEAVRRFDALAGPELPGGRASGIIASLDADAVVDENYLLTLLEHFRTPEIEGCSIYFEHPLREAEDPFAHEHQEFIGEADPDIYKAIAAYELHLRYYLYGLRITGYPYAYHTVGSAFAVRASAYVAEGGMSRRQGGEDFYFIQKVAQRGYWSDCKTTRVVPSPRPSTRVPFGTGPAVRELCSGSWPLLTYHPVPFRILEHWLSKMDLMRPGQWASPYPALNEFLLSQDFDAALTEIRANSASPAAYHKRFWRWFNMFRIMKFLHFCRQEAYPDAEIRTVASLLSGRKTIELFDLLQYFRELDRS